MKLNIYKKVFQKGINLNTATQESFKDFANVYFRRNEKDFIKSWSGNYEKLILKFDDRLNKFFLYSEYTPAVGFYFYKQTLQIVPFYNPHLSQAVAQLIDFAEKLNKIPNNYEKEEELQWLKC